MYSCFGNEPLLVVRRKERRAYAFRNVLKNNNGLEAAITNYGGRWVMMTPTSVGQGYCTLVRDVFQVADRCLLSDCCEPDTL
ncbi:MAG: hypothetical protein LBB84_04425 [Tannerellaceae bacterium]|nr:hypothetical protein [Tannerellaceae bacterium]